MWTQQYNGLGDIAVLEGFGYFGDPGRYVPSPEQILVSAPRPGTFYRPRTGIYPATVANVAYKQNGTISTYAGLQLMNKSTWNDHIRKSSAGYENYPAINQGIQFTPKYDPDDPLSTHGSGHAYPVVWVPPEDGREPEEVFSVTPPGSGQPVCICQPEDIDASVDRWMQAHPIPPGAPGEQGIPGIPGEQGIPGAIGRPPTQAEIDAAVAQWMEAHPRPPGEGISAAEIEAAVAAYMAANPVPGGQVGPPGPPPTQAEIDTSVDRWMQANPIPSGSPGEQGIPGPPPTDAEINAAVAQWMQANPIPTQPGQPASSGGGGTWLMFPLAAVMAALG